MKIDFLYFNLLKWFEQKHTFIKWKLNSSLKEIFLNKENYTGKIEVKLPELRIFFFFFFLKKSFRCNINFFVLLF